MTNRNDDLAMNLQLFCNKLGLASGGLVVFAILLFANPASAQNPLTECGSLDNAYGPFDYRDPSHNVKQPGEATSKRSLVEGAHFTPEVENLIRGKSAFGPLPDLDYTLRVFPNHHRALASIANYHLKLKKTIMGRYSINCWFERAIRFRSDDGTVRIIYAIYLARVRKTELALEQYKAALSLQPNSAEAHYNVGLLYTNMKNYDLAYDHAVRAYELGHPLPGLRNRLKRSGAWKPESEQQ